MKAYVVNYQDELGRKCSRHVVAKDAICAWLVVTLCEVGRCYNHLCRLHDIKELKLVRLREFILN